MNKSVVFVVSIGLLLSGCIKGQFDNPGMNMVTIHPAKLHNGAILYPIGSVFVGGGTADPLKGLSNRCHIYKEPFAESPDMNKVQPLIAIYGFKYTGVDYDNLGQSVNQIIINGLDESLGLGTKIDILMKQGKYEGGNDLIKSVVLNAYKFSSSQYIENHFEYQKNADIDIVIQTMRGDIITIRYKDDVTPWDGYY